LLLGVAIGAVAAKSLHAQVKPIYLVTEIDVTNPDAYGTEYAPKVQTSITTAGGRILAEGGAGGAGAKFVTQVEGQPPSALLFRFGTACKKCKPGAIAPTTKRHARLATNMRSSAVTQSMASKLDTYAPPKAPH
jgi:uncharacterized protein (DUF1330 family)